jgi:hypothetical protein
MSGIRSWLARQGKSSAPATTPAEESVEEPAQERSSEPPADELAERAKRAAESILENESLTADLDDQAAKVLLDWGTTCARTIATSTSGLSAAQAQEAMDLRLRAVRQFMRSINGWAAEQQGMDAEGHAARLVKVLEQAAIAYGTGFVHPAQEQRDTFLAQQVEQASTPQQWIAELRALIEQA